MRVPQIGSGVVLGVVLASCHSSSPPLPDAVQREIIAFNDFHGNLLSPGKLAADPTGTAAGAHLPRIVRLP